MNKSLHLFLFTGLLIILFCICFSKYEGFGNPFDTAFEFGTNSGDQDIDSGYKQEKLCYDDKKWKKGNKTCRDYSISGSNCFDIGDNGKTAFESCLVSCDNCPSSVRIKRKETREREPSPIEDTEEPSYSVFENINDFGSAGGEGMRELLNKFDELSMKVDLITNNISSSGCENIVADNIHNYYNSNNNQFRSSYFEWYISYILSQLDINLSLEIDGTAGSITPDENYSNIDNDVTITSIDITDINGLDNINFNHDLHKIEDISTANDLYKSLNEDFISTFSVSENIIIKLYLINKFNEFNKNNIDINNASVTISAETKFNNITILAEHILRNSFNNFFTSNPEYNNNVSISIGSDCNKEIPSDTVLTNDNLNDLVNFDDDDNNCYAIITPCK